MPIKNRIAEMHDEIAAWRRDFHQHPELQYDTNRTAAIVAGQAARIRLRRGGGAGSAAPASSVVIRAAQRLGRPRRRPARRRERAAGPRS